MIGLNFSREGQRLFRRCTTAWGETTLETAVIGDGSERPESLWLASTLRDQGRLSPNGPRRTVRILDAFCGCGGFALGVSQGLEGAGLRAEILGALDMDPAALGVYAANLQPRRAWLKNVNATVDFQMRGEGVVASYPYPPTIVDSEMESLVGNVDVFISGPPCQGHSNLNNQTRRTDPRNLLYVTAASLGIAVRASLVVIENVPQVVRSHKGVVAAARALLESSGYSVEQVLVDASLHGCAQSRKRHFTFAHRGAYAQAIREALSVTKTSPIPVSAVLDDLLDKQPIGIDEPAVLSEENERRIRYLFENDVYQLPDDIRPLCHRDGHTYPSVYGRMKWDEPAQTITSGFMSPGRGRFIHPKLPRTLTMHEAARIQGFPDSYRWLPASVGSIPRATSARMIADAVPPPLGFVVGLAAAQALATDSRTTTEILRVAS
jgi:DNA (cytosine-5)-methyltransferase 1